MIRWFYVLLLLCCTAIAAQAQFRIAINLRNPPPAEIATWRDDPSVATVVLEALDRDYDMVYLGIEIINLMDNNVYARSRVDPSMRSLMSVRRNVPITLSGSQIIETRNIDYPGTLETRIATTGILPDGQYLFCVRLYDRTFRELTGAGTNNCQPFSIVLPTALQLRLPLADASIQHTVPNVFSWTPVTMRADVPQYRVVIAPVFEGQVPLNVLQSAFDRVAPTVVDVTVPTTEYLLQPFHPVLLQMVQRRAPRVTGFAWQVQALGMNGRPIALRGSAQGKSDYRVFTLQDDAATAPDCRGPMTLENIFPAANDTIPWIAPHCIVEWGPFCDGIRSMDYTLTIQPPSGAAFTNQRLLRWDAGVLESQGIQASAPLATVRARRIVTNWRDNAGGTPALNAQLRRGDSYRWSVEATFDRGANGRQQRITAATTFTIGLRTPQEPSPANDARVDASALQALTFTIPPPQTLQFTPSDLHTVRRSDMRMEFGLARERCRIVLSQHADCSAPLVQSTRWLGRDGGYTTGESDVEAMFGRQDVALTEPLAPGTYFWRVEYLDWANGDRVYRQGPVWRFVIERNGVDADECVRLTAAAPAPRSTVSDGVPIRFSVSTNPVVRLDAIRGGTVRVWEMSSANEAPSNVRLRQPVVERRFSGNDARSIVAAPGLGTSTQRSYFNLPFMDGALTVRPHTNYLWECTLDVNGSRLRADDVTCSRSQIVSTDNIFTVGATTACSDPCMLPSSTVLREVPATRTFAPGDVITIGQFRARLTAVSGTAATGLRGEAVVAVPILRGGVSVSFENLAVNDDGIAYRGEMQAKMAAASPIPASVANALDGTLGLNREQLGTIWSLAADTRRLTSSFLGSEAMTMPIGFDRVVEGERFVIGVMGMVFKPRDARLNVVVSVPLPWLGPDERLGAGLRNICFHPNGFGREIEIGLTEDLGYTPSDRSWSFHFLGPRTADAARGIVADSGTYVRFGCLGFEALRVKAEVRFPRTWMIPVAADGSDADGLVRATLATTIRRGGNFLAEATMGRFRPADVPDFIMEVRSLVVDMSDVENGSRMSFPSGYRGDMSRAWRGFFIDSLTMRLPDAIRTFDSTRPVQVDLRTMLIDRTGFSMQAAVRNVIQYPRGNFGSWGASLDTLQLRFVNSSFSEGRMTGRLKVPISDSVLDYRASLSLAPAASSSRSRIGFQFVIQPRGTINAPLWIASLQLAPTSRITMETDPAGQFRAIANFSGMLTIAGDAPRAGTGSTAVPGLDIRGVRFDDLRFQTHAEPYISLRSLALASPQHGAAGFPVSFTGFTVRSGNRTVGGGAPMPSAGLQLGARFSLQRGAEAIGGDTRLTLWGSLRTNAGGPPQFVFGGVDLDEIGIDADMKAVRVAGRIQFFSDDARYGNGFRGSVSATFVKLLQVDATVQFGTTSGPAGFPYWYVDARGALQRGIPIMSGIALYGFGGGAWYNMRRDVPTDALGRYTVSDADRALLQGTSTPTVSTAPGGSPTGITYVPDRPGGNDALGLYALVSIGTHPKADAFNADLRLTAEFSTGPTFGIRTISLDGQGYMMASLTERSNAPITMNALVHWDISAERLTGNFGIRVRYPQTQPKLFADGTLNILISPTAWHIKLGSPAYTPNERIRLSLGGDGLDASNALLSLNAYLMAGTNLQVPFLRPPAFPEDLWARLQAKLSRPTITADRGDGFAFGASMAVTPPELQFLVFYANFRFVAGLDLSMLNVGRQSCAGRDAIGANGWYSRGQLYAYISGGVGLKADLGFWEGKLELASVTMASILEGGTPNPMWLTGAVEGWYSVLGGALQGSFDFQFAVGERCVPARDIPLPLNILTSLTPEDGRTDVSAIAQPTATSTYRFNEAFDMIEMHDGQRIPHTYRVVCDGFHVAPTDNPAMSIAGTTTIDPRDPSIVRNTLRNVHQYNKEYLAIVMARVEKARVVAGVRDVQWFTATNTKTGAQVREELVSTYRTEGRPDTIAPEQVWNTYPRNRQRYFLQDECREGFIRMAGSYGHLFGAEGGVFNEVVIRFQEMPGGAAIERPVTYTAGRAPSAPGMPLQPLNSGGSLSFAIPQLRNGALYSAQVVRRMRTSIPVPTGLAALSSLAARLRSDPSQSMNAMMISVAADAAQSQAVRRELTAARTQQFQQAMGSAGTVSVRQANRGSALDEARNVAPGETLVFLFFFRTSQYNTLESKVATLQQRTATVITSQGTNVALLRGTYGGPELFDRHDVEQVTITMPSIPQPGGGGLEITLPPLLSIGATASSVWHQTFAQPQVLSRIDAMRTMWSPYWSPNLWTTRIPNEVRTSTGHEYFYVETSASAMSLSDAELSVAGDPRYAAIVRAMQRTFTTRSQVLSGQSSGYAIPSGSTPTAWQITYDYPFWLCLDWGTMRQRAALLRTMGCMEILGNQRCADLQTWSNTPFQLPGRGTYDFWLRYNSPCAVDADRQANNQRRFTLTIP